MIKVYPCDHSDKTYSSKTHLQSHIQSGNEKQLDLECKSVTWELDLESRYKIIFMIFETRKELTHMTWKKCGVFTNKDTAGVWLCDICPKKLFFPEITFDKHIKDLGLYQSYTYQVL